jgi:hypothetical protein
MDFAAFAIDSSCTEIARRMGRVEIWLVPERKASLRGSELSH